METHCLLLCLLVDGSFDAGYMTQHSGLFIDLSALSDSHVVARGSAAGKRDLPALERQFQIDRCRFQLEVLERNVALKAAASPDASVIVLLVFLPVEVA